MKWLSRSMQGALKQPQTVVHDLLDDQMTLFIRSWGSQDYNQRLIEEVSMYMSSAQADIDVTSPFDFREDLSSLANKTRVAMLLAHDYFFRSENKNEYFVGFEVFLTIRSKNEMAWSSVGRFSVSKIQNGHLTHLSTVGSDLDENTLLPARLLGTEKDVDLISGSISVMGGTQVLLTSCYGGQLEFDQERSSLTPNESDGTYWYSTIKFD